MSQVEDSFARAIALVVARVDNDTHGIDAVLDGLDRDEAVRLASSLAAAFAQFGVESSGSPDRFREVLGAMRERF